MIHQKNTWMLRLHCKANQKEYIEIYTCLSVYMYTCVHTYIKCTCAMPLCITVLLVVLFMRDCGSLWRSTWRCEHHGDYVNKARYMVFTLQIVIFLGGGWGKAFLFCNIKMWKTVFNLLFSNFFFSGNHINLRDVYLVYIFIIFTWILRGYCLPFGSL